MNPTRMTRSMPSAASKRSPDSRSEPSPGSMKRTRAPSSRCARSAPRYAPSLKDLSPRPPRSNTLLTSTAAPFAGAAAPDGLTNSRTTCTMSSAPTRISSLRMEDKATGGRCDRKARQTVHAMGKIRHMVARKKKELQPERLHTRFLVVGSGVAGLHTAWRASQHGDVLLLTKRSLFDSATAYAQGGIAAALGGGDSPALHRRDTLAAGAALCDAAAVQVLVEEGPARVRQLQTAGAEFDIDPTGRLMLGREGAHSAYRIVHAHGDQTGAEVARTLIDRVRHSRKVRVLEKARVLDLIVSRGAVLGVRASVRGHPTEILADATVLATGG